MRDRELVYSSVFADSFIHIVKYSTMLRRLQGESDIGFYGDDSSDGGPYEKDISTNPPPAPAEYDSPGYRDTYDYTSAASIPLSPWCIAYYVILPSFALFGLVVAIYYWRCCPWLCCYRDDDDNAWRDRSKNVRGDSERTEGTAENPSAKKSNGVPASIAIAIPEGFVEPQQQQMERRDAACGERGAIRKERLDAHEERCDPATAEERWDFARSKFGRCVAA